MQVRRVDSRTLSRKGDPCCILKAPYAMSYQAPHSARPVPERDGSRSVEMAGRLRDRSVVCARRHLAERCVPARWLKGARQGFFVPLGGFTCFRYRSVPVGRCSRVARHHFFSCRVSIPELCQVLARPFIAEGPLCTLFRFDGWLAADLSVSLSACFACPGTSRWPRPISRDWMGQDIGEDEAVRAIAQSSFEASCR